MQYKIGKVIDYDNYSGKIISIESEYFFLKEDTTNEIKNGDIVKFRDENRKDKRVFFVEKYKKNNS